MIIVASTSLPAVDRSNADPWNGARSCQKLQLKVASGKLVATLLLTHTLMVESYFWFGGSLGFYSRVQHQTPAKSGT